MEKRAQVSLFVITAIIILGGISLYVVTRVLPEIKHIDPEIAPLYATIEECMRTVGEDAIQLISRQGGYYHTPPLSALGIPYYLYERKNNAPHKEEIEIALAEYMSEHLSSCTQFEMQSDYTINKGKITTLVTIGDDNVVFNVNYPLSIQKGEKSYDLDRFEIELPVRLGVIYDSAYHIVENELGDSYICVDCMDYFAETYALNIKLITYTDTTVIISIRDEQSTIKEEALTFNFLNQYE